MRLLILLPRLRPQRELVLQPHHLSLNFNMRVLPIEHAANHEEVQAKVVQQKKKLQPCQQC